MILPDSAPGFACVRCVNPPRTIRPVPAADSWRERVVITFLEP
jgi:hypothetical protein